MRRRGVILGMVLLLGFQSLGYYAAFVVQVGLHKAWAREQVADGDAETLAFLVITNEAYENLAWAGESEFWHEGVLHDLKVATQAPNGSWRVLCMRDESETRLLTEGKAMMAEAASNDSEEGSTVSLLLGFPGILAHSVKLTAPLGLGHLFGQSQTLFQDHLPVLSSPPPQQV